jgi:hypothetical protein
VLVVALQSLVYGSSLLETRARCASNESLGMRENTG